MSTGHLDGALILAGGPTRPNSLSFQFLGQPSRSVISDHSGWFQTLPITFCYNRCHNFSTWDDHHNYSTVLKRGDLPPVQLLYPFSLRGGADKSTFTMIYQNTPNLKAISCQCSGLSVKKVQKQAGYFKKVGFSCTLLFFQLRIFILHFFDQPMQCNAHLLFSGGQRVVYMGYRAKALIGFHDMA